MSDETFAGEPLDPYALKDESTRLRADLAAERDRNGIITQAAQEVTNALRAENEKLREALQPFADKATQWEGQPERQITVMLSECRRARAALEGVTKKSGAGYE